MPMLRTHVQHIKHVRAATKVFQQPFVGSLCSGGIPLSFRHVCLLTILSWRPLSRRQCTSSSGSSRSLTTSHTRNSVRKLLEAARIGSHGGGFVFGATWLHTIYSNGLKLRMTCSHQRRSKTQAENTRSRGRTPVVRIAAERLFRGIT